MEAHLHQKRARQTVGAQLKLNPEGLPHELRDGESWQVRNKSWFPNGHKGPENRTVG